MVVRRPTTSYSFAARIRYSAIALSLPEDQDRRAFGGLEMAASLRRSIFLRCEKGSSWTGALNAFIRCTPTHYDKDVNRSLFRYGYCVVCGMSNPPTNNYCMLCGTPLPRLPAPSATGICAACYMRNPPFARRCGRCGATLGTGPL
jgi:ribosomal protein L40E